MNLIHEVDPSVNYYPMYSVEYKPKVNPTPSMPEVWAQHTLTPSKWSARLALFELLLRGGSINRRVRVL